MCVDVLWAYGQYCAVPLAEGVQAGQHFGVVVVVQADAAHQELLVDLPHHRAGAPGLTLGHGERHSKDDNDTPLATTQPAGKQTEKMWLNIFPLIFFF